MLFDTLSQAHAYDPSDYMETRLPLDRNTIMESGTIQACFDLLLKDESESMAAFSSLISLNLPGSD